MKLESLQISGFRGISELELEFPEGMNVLVGDNGSGKSAILDCAAIMLSRLIGRIRASDGTGRLFLEDDITNGLTETRNEIKVFFQNESIQWRVSKARRGRRKQRITNPAELRKHVESLRSQLEQDQLPNLPLAVYYPVNRAVLDIPLRIRKKHRFDRLAAYDQTLSGASSSFRVFFEWFREREDLENELRAERPECRDPQLQAVRRAVESFLPGFTGLKVRRSPLRMVVAKDGDELNVSQLSDCEKCTLAMAGDLARRMAIANPAASDPLKSPAVVLIDEIDLHLHPGWQRHITTALTETFPNCQYLLSTHSPQVISHLDRQCIWILERTESGVAARRPEDAYGQTATRILEDIMKCTLAMAGDLARRMAIANPAASDPLKSPAVVLIDEIDLHLHPGWQRHITTAFKETFPNCQYLLSTHSPQVISHLDRQCIWILERTESGVAARRPEDAYGQTATRILEDIMDVPARPQKVKDELTELFLAIQRGDLAEARLLLSNLRQEIGRDPDLVKADVLIRRTYDH